jgi:hypothetical protein
LQAAGGSRWNFRAAALTPQQRDTLLQMAETWDGLAENRVRNLERRERIARLLVQASEPAA